MTKQQLRDEAEVIFWRKVKSAVAHEHIVQLGNQKVLKDSREAAADWATILQAIEAYQ